MVRCSECKKELDFNKIPRNRKTCDEVCAHKRKLRLMHEANGEYDSRACSICGQMYIPISDASNTCTNYECRKERNRRYLAEYKRKRTENLRMERDELLGPEFPEMPMRKCHTAGCDTMSYNYWCDACRGVFRVSNGVTGLSGTGELFSGAIIETGLVR